MRLQYTAQNTSHSGEKKKSSPNGQERYNLCHFYDFTFTTFNVKASENKKKEKMEKITKIFLDKKNPAPKNNNFGNFILTF